MKKNATATPKAKRTGDGFKYFNELQVKLIRRTARDAAQLAKEKGQITAIRDWMLIDLLTSTGVREAEASDMRCGDILAGYGQSACYIRSGKGDKSRTIQIPDSLRIHLKSFLVWKQEHGEPVGEDAFLFIGQRGPWTPWAVGEIVKKYLRQLGLYQTGKSVHSLRHYLPFLTMSSSAYCNRSQSEDSKSWHHCGERVTRHSLFDPTGC
jgi:site-specific recombinase XerD